jgi:hypothetical protein
MKDESCVPVYMYHIDGLISLVENTENITTDSLVVIICILMPVLIIVLIYNKVA